MRVIFPLISEPKYVPILFPKKRCVLYSGTVIGVLKFKDENLEICCADNRKQHERNKIEEAVLFYTLEGNLEHEEIVGGVTVLTALAQVNQALDTGNSQLVLQALQVSQLSVVLFWRGKRSCFGFRSGGK